MQEPWESQSSVSPPAAALSGALAALRAQGLGHDLGEDVAELARCAMGLQVELARRMAAWTAADATADPVGACAEAGIPVRTARLWRRAAQFAAHHPALHERWLAGAVTAEQAVIVARGTRRLAAQQAAAVIGALAPALPGLTMEETRAVVEGAVDTADPPDARRRERDDYEHRRLAFTGVGGGIDIAGYLPAAEAGALQAAIAALAEEMRAEGDGLSMAQRRADALAELVARATAHGLPAGGGLPVALTLTVSAAEAARIAATGPADPSPRRGPHTTAIGHSPAPVGDATARFALCCAPITPVHHHDSGPSGPGPRPGSLAARIAGTPVRPLQVGRAVRLATPAQRRALHLRDNGCAIPGCRIASGYTQPHHITPWALGGTTDLHNLISLCWNHHRQVEHGHWDITPAPPGSAHPFTITRNRR